MSDDQPALHAELEYLHARERELDDSPEPGATVAQAGMRTSEPIRMDRVCALAEKMIALLRWAGDPTLEAAWSGSFLEWQRAQEQLETLIARLRSLPEELTTDDLRALNDVRERLDDATEHFERVHAQTVAWFDRRR